MKSKLFALFLLGTTFLTPSTAHADPGSLAAIASTFASAVAGTEILIAGVGPFAFLAPGTLGGAIFGTLVATGINYLITSLLGSNNTPKPSDRMVNFSQPVSYVETVYGKVRKGGPIGFTAFNNNKRYYNVLLAGHQVESVVQHYLDERRVILDEDGFVTGQYNSIDLVVDSPCENFAKVVFHDGESGQVVDTDLVTVFPSYITSDHDFDGLAYSMVRAKRASGEQFSKVYPRGREWAYTALLEGKNDIYDPRTGTTGYTDNAALIIADWIVDYLGEQVDWDEVATEADECDVIITDREGNTAPKWELGITLSDNENFEQHRNSLCLAADTFLYERTDGKIGFKVGRWIEPTVTLTDEDFFSLDKVNGFPDVDIPNSVSCVYVEPDNYWREQTSAEYTILEPGDIIERRNSSPQIFACHNHNQAARINKRLLLTQRANTKISGSVGLIGYELIGQRFIHVTHTGLGIDGDFEISELIRGDTPGVWSFVANSVNETDFDFDSAIEEGIKPVRNSIDEDAEVGVPTNVGAVSTGNGTITVYWDNADDSYLTEVTLTPEDATGEAGGLDDIIYTAEAGAVKLAVSGLVENKSYAIQVRHKTSSGYYSDYAPDPALDIVVYYNSTAPLDLDDFTVTGGSGKTTLDITTKADVNVSYVKVQRLNYDNVASAPVVMTLFLGPSETVTIDDDPLSVDFYYYWATPYNQSGVAGTTESQGPVEVT